MTIAAYALPGVPLAVLGLPVFVFLPAFYAENTALGITLVGVLLFVARLLDVVTDPLIGSISDRMRNRFRRRLPMLLGVPVLLVSAEFLLRPAGIGTDAAPGALYLFGFAALIYFGWTLITLPYQAWGAELSNDYHERSRITASREAFVVVGTVIAIGLPAALGHQDDAGASLAVLAQFLWVALPLTILVLLWKVPERQSRLPAVPWRHGWALMRSNRPFRRLLIAWFLNGTANAIPATLFLLYITHVLEAPGHAGILLLVYFLVGVAALPLWLMLARRIGKHRAWIASMLLASSFFIWVPLLGTGDLVWFYIITVITGMSLGIDLAIPASMQADVIDQDTADGGGERAGLFFGLWGMTTKLALAAAVGITFPLLGIAGFDAQAETHSTGALLTLSLAYALIPVAFKLAAVALVWRFEIDESAQHELRRRINARLDETAVHGGHSV